MNPPATMTEPRPVAPGAAGARPAPRPPYAGPGGFLLLDKPVGISSFLALRPVKRLFHKAKVGHAGTLDPAASGLLLVGIGHGTRLLEYLEGMPKAYAFTVRFGLVSDSYDMEGVVTGEPALGLARQDVERALGAFRGRIRQAPPAYSAVKVEGRRAYDLARAGETVALAPREVEVHSLVLLDYAEGAASLRMECSKGTYVRSLAHDLGRALGCGALADGIRRLAIGPFRVEDAMPASALEGASDAPATGPGSTGVAGYLLPLETAVAHLPAAVIPDHRLAALKDGRSSAPGSFTLLTAAAARPGGPGAGSAPADRSLATAPSPPEDPSPAADRGEAGDLRVLDSDGRLLAIATLNPEGHLCPKKVLARS